tara:strand:- start:998 stop:1432 length:435 start_codon:yes stop_codon:yes gene_type:complete
MSVFDILESKFESGQGSKKGRKKKSGPNKKGEAKATKARARVYDTLKKATSGGKPGDVVTTKGSDRLYVLSKASWGSKSSGTIAKGFTPGSSTPGSDFKSIKAHAARTSVKHGSSHSERLKKKYGVGVRGKIKNSLRSVGKSGK